MDRVRLVKPLLEKHFNAFVKLTVIVEDREHPGRPSEITEEKIDEVAEVIENEPESSVRSVATSCSIPRTAAHRIITEHLSLKPYKVQFVQELYEEDMQDKAEMQPGTVRSRNSFYFFLNFCKNQE